VMSHPMLYDCNSCTRNQTTPSELTEQREFGARLKVLRTGGRLSRRSVAKLSGISEATVKFIETNRTKPTLMTLLALLSVPQLGLTVEDCPSRLRDSLRASLATAPKFAGLCLRCKTAIYACSWDRPHCQMPSLIASAPSDSAES